ncbi:hypothetical protein EMPS_11234 [Entomortierella parvispora]|uniref:Uncharacterized protein n=1 Tax=Entomortierella parvispora TaxID=205924 RepID=A0A9P3HLP5_9FUNG|nr:hypothetical protein EMPS_11234 [Entomortierella parvispora]
MADHSAPYSASASSGPPASAQRTHHQHQHHAHFQVQHRHPLSHHHHHQDYHGPLSAGVVEGGHRAFPSFHGSLRDPYPYSLHHSHSQTFAPSSSTNSNSASTSTAPVPSTSGSSAKTLSVADILERYQDASKDFLVTVLNAKAKEDERKAEEERYRTEQVKLQSKQLELELVEKRRGSPPAGNRPYSVQFSESHGPSSASPYYRGSYNHSYTPTSEIPRSSKHTLHEHHHEHHPHDTQDHTSSSHAKQQQQQQQQQHQDQHSMQQSPQGRPFLKINTSFRQYQPQPHSSQRLPPSPAHTTLPPLPATNPGPKSSNRHYGLSTMTTSAQSSPVAVLDYQSHIPPPFTPKEDQQTSPTSAMSPTQGQNLKRKSINHDAIMDAVRAKVLRNAGQNQQQKKAAEQQAAEREHANGRRKTHHGSTGHSPERPKKYAESLATVPESEATRSDDLRKVKIEGSLMASLPLTATTSVSPPISPESRSHQEESNSHPSSRSRSSSPPPLSSKPQARRQMSKSQGASSASAAAESEADSGPASSRTDYHTENGVLVK